jgi:hypothetical protein
VLLWRPIDPIARVFAVKCPYCSEVILEEAIVCKHCQRDLIFFRPVREQIVELERKLTALSDPARSQQPERLEVSGADVAPMIAVLASAALSFTIQWVDWRPIVGTHYDWLFQSAAIAAPFVPAYIVARWVRRLRVPAAISLGVTAGALGYMESLVLFGIGKLNEAFQKPQFTIPLAKNWLWNLAFYLALGALFFYLGATLGRQHANPVNAEPSSKKAEASPSDGTSWINSTTLLSVVGFLSVLLKNLDNLRDFVKYLQRLAAG